MRLQPTNRGMDGEEYRIEPGSVRSGRNAAAEGGDRLSYQATLIMAAENGGQNRIISRRRAPDWGSVRMGARADVIVLGAGMVG